MRWCVFLGKAGPDGRQMVRQGHPLSEDVCGAVDGERLLRVVEVHDRSECSERSDVRDAGRKR